MIGEDLSAGGGEKAGAKNIQVTLAKKNNEPFKATTMRRINKA
jgi:hypothetical protein